MAARFVPTYNYSPTTGWYVPQMQGNNVSWSLFGPTMPDQKSNLGINPPSLLIVQPVAGSSSAANQTKPEMAPVQAQTTTKVGAAGSDVVAQEANKVSATKRKKISGNEKIYRYTGLVLALLGSASVSLGISNIIVTAMTVMTSSSVGCFGPSNSVYNSLGPYNSAMKVIDWSWVSVGLWASLSVLIAGNAAGGITKTSSTRIKVFALFGFLSVIVMIPVTFLLAILDVVLSKDCQSSNPTKFITPIVIVVLSVLEFALLVYMIVILRKQTKKQNGNQQTADIQLQNMQQQQFRHSTRYPYSSGNYQQQSLRRRGTERGAPNRNPNITIVNVQPPPGQNNLNMAMRRYPGNQLNASRPYTQYQPAPRWYPANRVNPGRAPNVYGQHWGGGW